MLYRLNNGSRMSLEVHIRFCEGLGVKILRSTHLFIERFFRSLKYEDVYLNKYSDVLEAKNGIAAYIDFYNTERFHQSLDYGTPDDVYFYNSKAVA